MVQFSDVLTRHPELDMRRIHLSKWIQCSADSAPGNLVDSAHERGDFGVLYNSLGLAKSNQIKYLNPYKDLQILSEYDVNLIVCALAETVTHWWALTNHSQIYFFWFKKADKQQVE